MIEQKTVRDILNVQRKTRSPDIEIALQDFLYLDPSEQIEFLLVGLLETTRTAVWAQNTCELILRRRP